MSRRWLSLTIILWFGAWGATADDRVYVGASVCRSCHQDGAHRNQYSIWFSSAHARAYAALAMPESLEIARLSGIHENPFSNPVCLGCHATAAETEDWQRDATFDIADGVQCELCHGPGSEYIPVEVMTDPEAAAAAGLRKPTATTCLVCHKEKGSHTTVIEVRPFDVAEAMKRIDHSGRGGEVPPAPAPRLTSDDSDLFVGVRVCASCHGGSAGHYLASAWRLTDHARAWATLTSDRGRTIAAAEGVANPQLSEKCLKCHSTGGEQPDDRFAPGFDPAFGVQCESCHGPGGRHAGTSPSATAVASHPSEMKTPTRATCESCHTPGIHGSGTSFDWQAAPPLVDHTLPTLAHAEESKTPYKTPFNLEISTDGSRLYVACEASDSLVVVDTEKQSVVAEIAVEKLPHGVCLSPDGNRAYVSNRGSDSVSVIDTAALEVVSTIAVGDEPHGLTTDAAGGILYVANAGSSDVSVVDLGEGRESKRLAAARGAWDVARSPDDRSVLVTNNLSHFVPFRTPSRSEVTVIATERSVIDDRITIPEANLVQGIATAPSGDYSLVTLIRTKNLVPMTRAMQGWVMTNGLGVLWRDGTVDQLLLDEPEHYFADPTDIVITPDGRLAFVSGGGIDAVAVVDLERLVTVLENADPAERSTVFPNHMGISTEFVETRVPVGTNPRGLAMSPDGRLVYVAEALNDTIGVIDVARREKVASIDLGGPEEITLARDGERIFHSAAVTFGGQFSCHSCHPDGGIDAITYDIEPDGIGINPVDNRSLRGILDTAPFKWTGKNPSLGRQCGPRLAVFFTRIDPFNPEQVRALERYIQTIPRNPNRYRTGDTLTPAQRRGKLLFERAFSNTGERLEAHQRCDGCHTGPYFTNREKTAVGTASELDTHDVFDVPHLNNIYESAPYLHDGRAETLEEIWTRFNPADEHGVTNDMTKDQLNDLIEYLKTL
jgi:YVTN family beta-propeller protein